MVVAAILGVVLEPLGGFVVRLWRLNKVVFGRFERVFAGGLARSKINISGRYWARSIALWEGYLEVCTRQRELLNSWKAPR